MPVSAPGAPAPPAAPAPADPRVLAIAVAEVAAFAAVVDHGGFTAAARAMHLSQPGLSARVRRLERAVGATLVDRSVRRLTLTPAGVAFLPHARAVLESLSTGLVASTRHPGAAAAATRGGVATRSAAAAAR